MNVPAPTSQTGYDRVVTVVTVLVLALLQALTIPPPRLGFPTVAEAWSAPDARSTIKAAYRLFSVPDMEEHCRNASSVLRLIAKTPVTLRVGQKFTFDSLTIVAVGARNRPVSPTPLSLEIEEQQPPLFALSAVILDQGAIVPSRVGRFRFRARTICQGTSAEVLIPAVVTTAR